MMPQEFRLLGENKPGNLCPQAPSCSLAGGQEAGAAWRSHACRIGRPGCQMRLGKSHQGLLQTTVHSPEVSRKSPKYQHSSFFGKLTFSREAFSWRCKKGVCFSQLSLPCLFSNWNKTLTVFPIAWETGLWSLRAANEVNQDKAEREKKRRYLLVN